MSFIGEKLRSRPLIKIKFVWACRSRLDVFNNTEMVMDIKMLLKFMVSNFLYNENYVFRPGFLGKCF